MVGVLLDSCNSSSLPADDVPMIYYIVLYRSSECTIFRG
jgi:hypothetical protein